ncbi:glycosyl hydrolase family 61-domain-containing protein [Microdochium trichocladiopsis]|uniref:lytic cellulose monooxygenase (C4-dehydrogenating) n=1 Tax=Microdochium trichocladiopsis TaxID=1682393 RepID=A0A9P8Y6K2_9PEZI|nr:glycosyl hydrolase family 61-domain-containing protein [Microdochium trichocladiopsis]KAH7030897.1 glycosyl hydrolase family 61-domain-containing protein [Microdochium trichocladiopsis]
MKWSSSKIVPWLAVATAQQARSHSIFTTLFVDEVSQGDGTCVRMNPSPEHCTDPIPDLASKDMACGIGGGTPVAFTCPAAAGSKLTFQWRLWANAEKPGVIDKSHMGPCAIYAKHLDSMDTGTAAGDGWIKLWHEGYDSASGKWCTEKLIDNEGLLSINLPAGLTAGNWLFRPELLALQNVAQNDPQFYVGCAQVFVESSVTEPLDVPAKYKVSIPGHVEQGHPSTTFDVWNPKFPYTMPGPDVFVVPAPPATASSGGRGATSNSTPVMKQSAGQIPAKAISKNANWVGFEVPSFTNEDGCWKATENCWQQCEACYADAPVTGNANCQVFEEKCTGLNAACEAGNFRGPKNAGAKLQSADPAPPEWFPPAVNEGAGTGGGASDGGDDGEEGNDDDEENAVVVTPPAAAVTVTVTVTAHASRATGSA